MATFSLKNHWPAIAEAVGLEPAFGDSSIALSAFLPEHAAVWDRIVARSTICGRSR